MDEERYNKIAKAIKEHGIEKKETSGMKQEGNTGSFQINNSTVNINVGEAVPESMMSKEEREAYISREWDGIERRDFKDLKKQSKGVKQFFRRAADKDEHIYFYGTLVILILILMLWPIGNTLYNG